MKKKAAKKKVAKKSTTKKKTSKKKTAKKKEPKNEVPQAIKERSARLAKKKAEDDKKRKENERKIPDGAVQAVHDKSRSAYKKTKGAERDKFGWIEVLSKEVIRLSEENRKSWRMIEELQKKVESK